MMVQEGKWLIAFVLSWSIGMNQSIIVYRDESIDYRVLRQRSWDDSTSRRFQEVLLARTRFDSLPRRWRSSSGEYPSKY